MSSPNNNSYRNNRQDDDIREIRGHLSTLNDEVGDVKIDMAEVKTNVKWLRDNNKFVIGSSITTLLAILGILIKLLVQ